jgi:hypothetical protein
VEGGFANGRYRSVLNFKWWASAHAAISRSALDASVKPLHLPTPRQRPMPQVRAGFAPTHAAGGSGVADSSIEPIGGARERAAQVNSDQIAM